MTPNFTWEVRDTTFEDITVDGVVCEKAITSLKAYVKADDGNGNETRFITQGYAQLDAPDPAGFLAFTAPPLDQETLISFLPAEYKTAGEEAASGALERLIAESASNKGAGLPPSASE